MGRPQQPGSLHRYVYGHQNPQRYVDPDGRSATVVGAVTGFFWGFGQTIGALGRDAWSLQDRGFWDYMAIWGRNIYGGAAIGASIDAAAIPGVAGALGGAGFEALTAQGESGTLDESVAGQAEGAALGAAFDVAVRTGAAALGPAVAGGAKLLQRVPGVKQATGKVSQLYQRASTRLRALHDETMEGLGLAARRPSRAVIEPERSGARDFARAPSAEDVATRARANATRTEPGLATRGARPRLGERNVTREQYRASDRANRTRAREAAKGGVSRGEVPVTRTPYQVRIDPETRSPMAIDTSNFRSGTPTMRGGLRNARQFWKEWTKRYGDSLSETNRSLIESGRSPVVDNTWVQHFPEHSAFADEPLVHHHLDYGSNAIPLPRTVHSRQPGWGIWHPEHTGGK